MYNVNIIITNQNLIKNNVNIIITNKNLATTANITILFATLLIFVIPFGNT